LADAPHGQVGVGPRHGLALAPADAAGPQVGLEGLQALVDGQAVGLRDALPPALEEGVLPPHLAALPQVTELAQALLGVAAALAGGGDAHGAAAERAVVAYMEDTTNPCTLSLPLGSGVHQAGHEWALVGHGPVCSSRSHHSGSRRRHSRG